MKSPARRLIQGTVGAALACGLALAPQAEPQTRDIMHGVFDAIAYLLPLSVRDAETTSQWDREPIDAKLKVLRESSASLAAHTKEKTPEFALLASSFDETVHDIDASFREEWPSYAYFSLMELTQHCVACHAQNPAAAKEEFSQRLLARVNTDLFDDSELAQLYVATRQFDAALHTLERKLMDPKQDAIDLDIAGIPLEYLSIAIGVAGTPERAVEFLGRFAQRPDVPFYLAQRLEHWRTRLQALAPGLAGAPDLDTTRKLFAAASGEFKGMRDRTAAIDDLVAAAQLRRFIAAQTPATGPALAEAYYMLGVIALRTMEPKYSPVPEMEVLFASAIKAEPKGAFAKPSYLLLEEFGYVRDVPLARAGAESSKLIDMTALRETAGLGR